MPQDNRPNLHELAAAYSATRDGLAKRDICVRAIDLKYVEVGAPLENIRALFGADFRQQVGENADSEEYGIVDFMPPLPSYVDEQGRRGSGGFIGWYMVVTHEHDEILGYYLSNTHK